MSTTDSGDLSLVLKSRIPIVVIESFEETRAIDMLTRIAFRSALSQPAESLYHWTLTDGLRTLGVEDIGPEKLAADAEEVLKVIKAAKKPGIYILCDFHPFLAPDHARVIRLLKDIALSYSRTPKTIVLISHALKLPPELRRLCAHFEMSLPDDEQIMAIIREEAKHWSEHNQKARVKTDNVTLQKILSNLKGLTHGDVRLLARNLIRDGAIQADDIPELSKAKFQLLDMEGVLSYECDTEQFSNVGGLDTLKRWLKERQKVFMSHDPKSQRDIPKGILLLGVQGSGKSLAAKAVAGLWGIPLLRVDMAALYNKYIGETEKNLRETLRLADTMAPCVLWFDEIEKGIARDNADNGTSQRILGSLLTWMSERKSPVFIVATSNDISALPPELIRKGRLDEIFFVDLPELAIRRSIFEIHLNKRGLDCKAFDLNTLAEMSEGFSGAEIEQAVVSAIYRAEADSETIATQHIASEINSTSPISIVMAESVQSLRNWARDRTIAAN